MSVTTRTRSAARLGLKVQRRVALAQLLFWPTVITTGALLGALVIAGRRRGRSSGSEFVPATGAGAAEALPVPDSPAATA
ncbi:hypothetical protein MCHUDSM44219_04821 [Mycolicibacterium chubuense]|jgi:hypothetical protein|uniref:Uncharacterized protein n=1 Tax=Mycolicibacterium chubuense TaxID=1800 RepID=A0A0J6VSR1_MYCCU|nr:hypothetical protein MCHUDSM44219_04821 [Mycolicibacterium chubuense]SPX99230.1 Uncharacterised protein [Mycolicibacterium chubuense]